MTEDWPDYSLKFFLDLGWSHVAAAALVGNMMWESGGNPKHTIIWDAKSPGGASHGSMQWLGHRWKELQQFSLDRCTPWTDPDTQLAFIDNELHTTERRSGVYLRQAITVEEANAAVIHYLRPGIPHADKRLALTRAMMKKLHGQH